MPYQLLVVDDEPNIVFTISETLSSRDLKVVTASTARDGIEQVRSRRPDVVLMDVRLPDMSGLDAFSKIHEIDASIPVIIMTAFAKTDTAIEAMRRGAYEYFVKPVDFNVLKTAVTQAIAASRLRQIPALLSEDLYDEDPHADLIVGRSSAMQDVYKTIGRVAPQDVTVLILGESGTGKELVARALYHYSKRSQKPFLAVNCAALSESLLESELFGHEKGAFTGADHRRIGKFEQVNGGTIFLDEIGDMTPATQAKALRLIQQQQFERLGGTTTIETNVRIIAATNCDLEAMVAAGTFRQDLFYRLNGFTLRLPPLRERREDIEILAKYFVKVLSKDLDRVIHRISDEAMQVLMKHDWPGNVRELYSSVRFAMVQTTGDTIMPDSLPETCYVRSSSSSLRNPMPATSIPKRDNASELLLALRGLAQQLLNMGSNDVYHEVIETVDAAILEEVLKHTNGNQVEASERLGISRMTLRSKLRAIRCRAELNQKNSSSQD